MVRYSSKSGRDQIDSFRMREVSLRDNSRGRPASGKNAGEKSRIIVADENVDQCTEIVCYLESFNIAATAASASELYRSLVQPQSRLVVLDIQIARESNFDLVRRIHSEFRVPIILIGDKFHDMEVIIGLESGADDYLPKPLFLRELVARVRAILRHQKTTDRLLRRISKRRRYLFNGWALDRRTWTLRDEKGQVRDLTKREFSLLVAFLERPGQCLSREELIRAVRVNADTADRAIDVMVGRLRRKLQRRPEAPQVIETVRAMGYSFNATVETF